MKITLPLSFCLFAGLLAPLHAEEELAPPNVDFFAEAQILQADMAPYGYDDADGLSITLGFWLNDVKWAKNSRFGLEASFIRQNEESTSSSFNRAPTQSESQAGASSVDVFNDSDLKLSGFALGAVWQSPRWVYLRGGAYLYSFKESFQQERVLLDNLGDTVTTITDSPSSNNQSGVAPYLAAGVAVPLSENIALTGEYRATQLESENYDTIGIGFRYSN